MSEEEDPWYLNLTRRQLVRGGLFGTIVAILSFWWGCASFLKLCPHPPWVDTEEDSQTTQTQSNDAQEPSNSEGSNLQPKAIFDYSPEEPKVGETVTFDGSQSNDPDSDITSYRWRFTTVQDILMDEGEVRGGISVDYTFESADTYVVILKVATDDGQTDSTRKNIEVESTLPINP